jgi:outer membrane protein insertion porin family
VGRAAVAFDWRAREFAVMRGSALGGNLDVGSRAFKSDFSFWRASIFWEQGIRFFRRHNLVYILGATLGKDLPLWWETTAGGNNLRGYLGQQFRGDTQLNARAEYHFPLFSVGSLDVRALGFYDLAAIWYRSLPLDNQVGDYWVRPGDGRSFNINYVAQGFDSKRDVHTDVGGGLRFFLRSVAVPLVGLDVGWGLESHIPRFILIVGA